MPDVTASYGTSIDFVFLRIFIHNWQVYTFWYINMPNVNAGYGSLSKLIGFLATP